MSERYYRGVYTAQALCEELGINRNTLANLVNAKILDYVKIGNHKVFSAKAINEMMDRYAGCELTNLDAMIKARALKK